MAILEKHRQSAHTAAKSEPSGVSGSKIKMQGSSKASASEATGKAVKSTETRVKSAAGNRRKDAVATASGLGGKAVVEEDSGPPLVASNKERRRRDELAMKVR